MPEVDLRQLAIERGDPSQPPLKARRHMLSRYVLPALLLAGFVTLLAWASRDLVFPPTPVTVVPVFVTEAQMQREGTPLFKAAGWIEPRPTPVRVAALAPGVVEQLLVVEDEPVEAGQPVAELVKDDARLALEKAEADLALQEADLELARVKLQAAATRRNQPVHLEAVLADSEAALAKVETALVNLPFETRRAEAQLQYARKDYQGKQAAEGVVSGRAIDAALSELEAAEALVEELKRRDASLKSESAALAQQRDALQTRLELLADEQEALGGAQSQVRAAEARVKQAEVAVADAQLRWDRMTVRAPIDGRVYRLIGHPGASVGMGNVPDPGYDSSTVVTLYRPTMLQVRVDVRFEDVPKLALGQPVQIDNPALSAPLTGKMLFISSEADIQKNTLQVKVEIESPPPVFKPEMLVDVTFLAPERSDESAGPATRERIYVPQALIRQNPQGPYVWVADQSAGVARRTSVETGEPGGDGLIEISAGLDLSSRLIATGHERLSDGDRIHVTGEDAGVPSTSGGHRSTTLNRLPGGEHP